MAVGPFLRDAATAVFLDGADKNVFLVRPCPVCGKVSPPQAQQCHNCGSTELGWEPASGGARVISWVISQTKPDENGNVARRALVIAELDEGPWWWSQLADDDPDGLAVGTRLRIDFERAEGSEPVAVFRRAVSG